MSERHLILTCMKNEGPFILEWVAYHLSIGIDHFLIYTNDCEDGTERILNRLQRMGHVTHRDNTRQPHQRPAHQIRAYRKAMRDPVYRAADWVSVIDADEFLNVHVGDRSIRALTDALPDARCISLTWKLFGSSGQDQFEDSFLTQSLRRAAPDHCPRPMQAWGMKTLHRQGAVEILGCHRPRQVPNDDWQALGWVDGNGQPMPERYFSGEWRMSRQTAGYKLAQINHYALRSRQSYLLKAARGRAFTQDMVGADYWHAMNRNEVSDDTIQPLLPAARAIYDELIADPVLARRHRRSVAWHKREIAKTLQTEAGRALMAAISEQTTPLEFAAS